MAQEREPLFYVAAGEKGVGKTYYTKNIVITNSIKGGQDMPARKVLVIDVNNEYNLRTLPIRITDNYNSIILFNKQPIIEARKISVFKADGDRKTPAELKTDLLAILKWFKNGLLIVEDLNKIVSDSVSAELFGYLCTNRHVDVDVMVSVQNIGRAGHPKIKSTMNCMRLHHVKESIWRHEDKFDEYTEILRIAQLIINNRFEFGIKNKKILEAQGKGKGDKEWDNWDIKYCKFYLFISFDNDTISGAFTKDEFEKAAFDYIYENEKYTIMPLLKRRDMASGKLLYNYKTATDKCIQDLHKYYGNK